MPARDEDAFSLSRNTVAQHYPRSGRDRRRRFLVALLVLPFLLGGIAVPAAPPSPVHADELSDAQAQQAKLQAQIASQKKLIANLNSSQAQLQVQIGQTKTQLDGITTDLVATRRQVTAMVAQVNQVQATYEALVAQLADLDLQLQAIEVQEAAKKQDLGARKAELADRIRNAYEAQRTSLLETFLSGASFTDMLAQMSTQLDAADQDRALAEQIAQDRATLLSLHQTVADTLAQTTTLQQQTTVQKQTLDLQLSDLRKAQARLAALEAAAKAYLASEQAQYARMASDKARLSKAVAAAAASEAALHKKIDQLVAAQFSQGNIPSQYNGTLVWPMAGTITQDFGCTGVVWEPPLGNCSHYHNGIDVVSAYGTPVVASAAGQVVYIGWNYADGADPAWIVIIAHSSELTTWYAHLQPRYPVNAGQLVNKGDVIGYEGNTGHSTGAHLHWMVEFNGTFVNPRLFV